MNTSWPQVVHQALAGLADAERALAMAAYMRQQHVFFGIPTPARRQAVAELLRQPQTAAELLSNAGALWAMAERECQYVAVDLLRRQVRRLSLADLPALLALVRQKSWWDSVDGLAAVIGALLRPARREEAQRLMDAALHDADLWVRRVAMLHQLGWRGDTDQQRLFAYALHLADEPDFFIRKAIGWALRDYARHAPAAVAEFLHGAGRCLSPLSRREAGKHLDLPLAASRQLLVVVAEDWPSTSARLQRFARASLADSWLPVGEGVPVTLGRAGLAWGIGLSDFRGNAAVDGKNRAKTEGDGCAPAGVFAIGELFGTAAPDGEFKLPYRQATATLKCVDDPASRHYNQFVDLAGIDECDWHSHEDMLRADHRYELGAVIAHNAVPTQPGAGSCIFLHVWEKPGAPTAGCTAAALADVRSICRWLDAAARPLLVQLPAAGYRHFQPLWGLPEMSLR